jgi:hypothetical protein
MREDLLAVGFGVTTRRGQVAHAALARLWEKHVPGLNGRCFQDAATHAILQDVLDSKDGRIRGAARWNPGAMVELVFGVWDMQAIMDLLGVLDAFLARERVVHYDKSRLGIGKQRTDGVLLHTRLHASGDDLVIDMAGKTDAASAYLPFKNIHAWSEPPLRGLCVTTTQACVFHGFATALEKQAFSSIVRACDPEQVNAETLYNITQRDKQELLSYYNLSSDGGGDGSTATFKETPPSSPPRSATDAESRATLLLS